MTDTEIETDEAAPPRPRAKAPVRRTPPPPRHPNGTVDRLAEMERELAELKAGGMRTVEAAPFNPITPQREADAEELTAFQQRLRAQTRETPSDFQRETVAYNYPERLFCKPDGTIVSLQGDPGNRGYYRDKGFTELSPDQVREWYGGERQKVIVTQRAKADLINSLREQVARDPNLRASISMDTELAWDHMSVAELDAFMAEVLGIPDPSGKPRRKLRPPQRLIDAENRKAQAEANKLLAGVETQPSRTARELFENAMPNAPHRTIEVTQRNAAQFR